MSDIYKAIKADHDRHRELLEILGNTHGDSKERQEAWHEFYHDVKRHAAAEEETFYSKLISKTWGQDDARHSVHEHKELDYLMEELRETDMSSGAWLQKFKKLRHDYEHHIEEEEDEVFAKAREIIPAADIKGYGDRFLERKEQEAKLIEKKREEALEE